MSANTVVLATTRNSPVADGDPPAAEHPTLMTATATSHNIPLIPSLNVERADLI
jgi:hypothetical protein